MSLIEIKLRPQPYQEEALLDVTTPIIGVAAGKRSGKSHVMIVMKSIFMSALHPGKRFVVASPTYGMTRRNLLPLYRQLSQELKLPITGLDVKNPDVLTLTWGPRQSVLHLDVTIENWGRMNGMSLAGAFVDEFDKANHDDALAFAEEALIRLSDPYPGRTAQLNIVAAPELNGALAEFFVENASPDKKLFTWSLLQNMCVSQEYKERIMRTIPASKQAGWVRGELMYNSDGLVYEDFDPTENSTNLTLADRTSAEPVYVTWDLNDGGTSALIALRRGDQLHVVEEWLGLANTKQLLDKVGAMPWADQALLTCDPACSQVMPYIIASKLKHRIMSKAPEVQWRVTAVNGRFNSAAGHRNLLISPRCKVLRRCLMRQTYVRGEPDKKTYIAEAKTDISGPLDALGYLVYLLWPYNPRGHGALRITGT